MTTTNDTLLVTDELMEKHEPGDWHPEAPARLRAVCNAFRELDHMRWLSPTPASRAALERIHRPEYVAWIDGFVDRCASLDPDTYVSQHSVRAAYLAAGSAVTAVTLAVQEEHCGTWALVRPPGHHAEPDEALGFCLFNNIAVAAAHARAELGCDRVLIVDWDVHHGNGTQHSFYDRADVLYFSTHQYPFFPGTGSIDEIGTAEGKGYNVNVPLPAGSTDGDVVSALRQLLVPIADAFEPNLVLVSAGFDGHQADPLAGMQLSEDGYAAMTGLVQDIARRHADARLAFVLEGGYDLDALKRCVHSCAAVLQGVSAPATSEPSPPAAHIIAAVADRLRTHWPV